MILPRFVINSTVGPRWYYGFLPVMEHCPKHDEDLGQTFGTLGSW